MGKYRLPHGLAEIRRNPNPARFTGNHLRWVAVIHGKATYCETRETARAVIAQYRDERESLIKAANRIQAIGEFYV